MTMKTFAQIKDGKAHWIFQSDECPEFAPDIVIADITDVTPVPGEGWSYDGSVFSPPPGPTGEQVRRRRDALLISCDWIVQRHREQVDAAIATTLTSDQYGVWTTYRQALRDMPKQTGFPSEVVWPEIPESA